MGCNSPNTLQRLALYTDEECFNVRLQSYPSVKSLLIAILHFNEFISLPPSNQHILTQLDAVKLDGQHVDNSKFAAFLERNDTNFLYSENIRKLTCDIFNQNINRDLFTKLILKLPKIQYLKLSDFVCNIDVEAICKLLPDLKALAIDAEDYISDLPHGTFKDLIHALGEKLEYLAFFNDDENIDYRLSEVNLKNLQFISVAYLTTKCINDILKTAVNLKQFRFHASVSVTSSELEDIMIKVFNSCKSLEYVEYLCGADSNKGIEDVLTGIEKGLFQTRSKKRKEMRICISTKYNDTKQAQGLVLHIGKVIHRLKMSQIEDFIFRWFASNDNDDCDMKVLLEDVKCVEDSTEVLMSNNAIIISNQNCKINGSDESQPIDFDLETLI